MNKSVGFLLPVYLKTFLLRAQIQYTDRSRGYNKFLIQYLNFMRIIILTFICTLHYYFVASLQNPVE